MRRPRGRILGMESSIESLGNVDNEAPSISVCIVCRNEGDRLGPCLDSVSWADEIIVMDLSSTDNSTAIAREYGARVVPHEPVPIVELVREELSDEARGEWILVLDPDERVSPGLAQELRNLANRKDFDAVVIPRTNFDLGYPPSNPIHRYEPQLRMYRRARVKWPMIPNALPRVTSDRVHRLSACDDLVIIHDRSRNIPEVLDRVIRYAPAEAQSMVDRGQIFTAKNMLITLARSVDKQFITGQPWRDGVPGVLRASILVAFKFYVWAAFWQLSGGRRNAADDRLLRRFGVMMEIPRRLLRIGGVIYRFGKRMLGHGIKVL
jgi:glycosyltransferase involved in cell wall biosynthesis